MKNIHKNKIKNLFYCIAKLSLRKLSETGRMSSCLLAVIVLWEWIHFDEERNKKFLLNYKKDETVKDTLALLSPLDMPLLWWGNLYFVMNDPLQQSSSPASVVFHFLHSLQAALISQCSCWHGNNGQFMICSINFSTHNGTPPINKKTFIKGLSIGGPSYMGLFSIFI